MPADTLSPARIETGTLIGFLDELKDSGYSIGTNQYVLAQDVLAAVVAADGHLDTDRFAALLGPVLCKSARQQAEFRSRYDRWLAAGRARDSGAKAASAQSEKDRAGELENELRAVDRSSRIGIWLTTVLAVLVLAAVYWLSRPRGPLPTGGIVNVPDDSGTSPGGRTVPQTEGKAPAEIVTEPANYLMTMTIAAVSLAILLGGGWAIWWGYRARRFLVRSTSTREPQLVRISVDRGIADLFSPVTVARVTRAMRRRVELASNELAVPDTIEQTSNRGGLFTPVYRNRQVTPEYLVLVDRSWKGDQTAQLSDELIALFQRGDVTIRRYYFNGQPQILFPSHPEDAPLLLREVAARYASDRLILITDVGLLTRNTEREIRTWCGYFSVWNHPLMLTLAPFDHRTPQYDVLRQRFLIFPATDDGLKLMAETLQGKRPQGGDVPHYVPAVPEQLRTRPERWLERAAPDALEVDELLLSLRGYLGDAGFLWLAACAVYPEIHLSLTLHLGKVLRGADGTPVFDAGLLFALNRLVWFRESYMPEWLRRALLREMSREREAQVRGALQSVLISALRGEVSGLELQIARQHIHAVSRLLRPILDRLSKTAEPGSPFKDRVFLSFLSGRTAVSVPDALKNLLRTGTWTGQVEPMTPRFTKVAHSLLAAAALFWLMWLGSLVEMALATGIGVAGTILISVPLMIVARRSLSIPVLALAASCAYCLAIAGFLLLLVGTSPIAGILAAVIALALAIAVFIASWSGVRFRSEPVLVGPIRRHIGYCAMVCGFLLFAGFPLTVAASMLWKVMGSYSLQILAGLLLLPGIVAVLTLLGLQTDARPVFVLGCLGLYWYHAFVILLGALFLIGLSADFTAALIVCLPLSLAYCILGLVYCVKSWRSWKRATKILALQDLSGAAAEPAGPVESAAA
jgi:hypothetical protein